MRKLTVLAAAMVATALVGAGVTALAARPDDPESELGKLMEKVQAHNATILKGVRSAANYKKSQPDVLKAAQELAKLGKESEKFTEPAEQQKKTQEEWVKLCKDWVKESDAFATLVEKSETTQKEAKDGYKSVQKSCTSCHDVFRVEDDE